MIGEPINEGGVRPLFKKENEMSSQFSAVISGVLITVVSAIAIGGFNMYTDLELVKNKTQILEVSIKDREDTMKNHQAMMHQMDKSLAVQMEAVNVLKDAVRRLEELPTKKENK